MVGATAPCEEEWACEEQSLEKATGCAGSARTAAACTRHTERNSFCDTASAQSGQRCTHPASSQEEWKRSAHGRQRTWPHA